MSDPMKPISQENAVPLYELLGTSPATPSTPKPISQETPEQLGRWAVQNMLPASESARADGIAARVAAIVRAERAMLAARETHDV